MDITIREKIKLEKESRERRERIEYHSPERDCDEALITLNANEEESKALLKVFKILSDLEHEMAGMREPGDVKITGKYKSGLIAGILARSSDIADHCRMEYLFNDI